MLQSGQGSSSEDSSKRMSPSAASPQKNWVVTSSGSEGPDCPSRATAPPYSRPLPRLPAEGTRRWLTFTLVDHRGNGRAHPYLQVSVENAEEAELNSGGGPGQEGAWEGGVTPAPRGPHVAGGKASTLRRPGVSARPLVVACFFSKQKVEYTAGANRYFCEPERRFL